MTAIASTSIRHPGNSVATPGVGWLEKPNMVLRAHGGKIAKTNRLRSPVAGSVRVSVTRESAVSTTQLDYASDSATRGIV